MVLRILLTGVDGSAWDLLGVDQPVQMLAGWTGLGLGEVTQQWADRIADGDVLVGQRRGRKTLSGPIRLQAAGPGLVYRTLARRWSRALSRDVLATLTVIAEDQQTRSIRVRLGGRADDEIDLEPGVLGWDERTLELVADSALWRGEPTSATWAPVTGALDFFGGGPVPAAGQPGTTKAAPFVLSPSGGFGDRSVTNPGDLSAWPTWRIAGPAAATVLAVGDQVIDVPGMVPAGQVLTLRTDPPSATLSDGTRAWSLLTGRQQLAAVAPRSTVTVSATTALAVAGQTQIACEITPLYDGPT